MLSPFAPLELFGLRYVGVYDGNNLKQTLKLLKDIKNTQRINLLHLTTTKGKGSPDAEKNAEKYHGIGKEFVSSVNSFSIQFGNTLCEMAKEKGTPVLESVANDVREKAIDVTKEVLKRLENN